MGLNNIRWLFIDCQTTGMRPSSGELLELAWCWYPLAEPLSLKSRILRITGDEVPKRISQITGIKTCDLESAKNPLEVLHELRADLTAFAEEGARVICVIHHSPFEIPFLKALFKLDGSEIPFTILDSSKIAKRLFPRLPSCNLRALAGHFHQPIHDLKRAGDHASATGEIWQQLLLELKKIEINEFDSLTAWLQTKPAKRKKTETPKASRTTTTTGGYEYAISKEFRLALPNEPGIYRMLASNGKILYVGKATSLRSRVNSYFRGRKGRDPKKLEMLTQVKNIEVTKTPSVLESALLENEEIKRHNPPYNVSLKVGLRTLTFYDRQFASVAKTHCRVHHMGPFRPFDGVARLRLLADHCTGRELGEFPNLFFMPAETEILLQAFENFCAEYSFAPAQLTNFRSSLAWAFWLGRRLGTSLDEEMNDEDPAGTSKSDPSGDCPQVGRGGEAETLKMADDLEPEERELTEEELLVEMTERYARLFLSAARAHRQMFELNRLLNCKVHWTDKKGATGTLRLSNGQYASLDGSVCDSTPESMFDATPDSTPESMRDSKHVWKKAGVVVLDRLSVLQAELRKQASVKIERDHSDVVGNWVLHCE